MVSVISSHLTLRKKVNRWRNKTSAQGMRAQQLDENVSNVNPAEYLGANLEQCVKQLSPPILDCLVLGLLTSWNHFGNECFQVNMFFYVCNL